MKIVGITGGIACGKSFVTQRFAAWGARTASADVDAREAVAPGSPALKAVLTAFPEVCAADGSLDRSLLARRIFADADARAHLESILHPEVFRRMRETIALAKADRSAPLLAYEVPLLFEKKRESLFDATIAVVCSESTQSARLQDRERQANRPPLTEAQLAERLRAQMPNDEKARRATYVIRTDGTIQETEMQAQTIWDRLLRAE